MWLYKHGASILRQISIFAIPSLDVRLRSGVRRIRQVHQEEGNKTLELDHLREARYYLYFNTLLLS